MDLFTLLYLCLMMSFICLGLFVWYTPARKSFEQPILAEKQLWDFVQRNLKLLRERYPQFSWSFSRETGNFFAFRTNIQGKHFQACADIIEQGSRGLTVTKVVPGAMVTLSDNSTQFVAREDFAKYGL